MNKCLEILVKLFGFVHPTSSNDIGFTESSGLGSHFPPDQLLGIFNLLKVVLSQQILKLREHLPQFDQLFLRMAGIGNPESDLEDLFAGASTCQKSFP